MQRDERTKVRRRQAVLAGSPAVQAGSTGTHSWLPVTRVVGRLKLAR
jgi:hypothetical protein